MKIILADDDRLVVMSLKTIIEADPDIEVLGVGYDGTDAVRLYRECQPDVVLMDIQMKELSGIEAAKQILQENRQAKILFLTTFSDDSYIANALELGAKGYILKQDFEGITSALFAVNKGQCVFGGEIVERITSFGQPCREYDWAGKGIGEKEIEIIARVAEGKSNREIADELFLSEGTVRNYISTILDKLSLRDRTQLAIFYLGNSSEPCPLK